MGVSSEQVDGSMVQQYQERRARMLANQGELSRAMSVFDANAVLNPNDSLVWEQLVKLHDPKTAWEALPDKPEGLDTDPQYEYELGTIHVGQEDHPVEVPTLEFVQNNLKRGVAQSLSGARYEHYKALPLPLLETMVHKILNGQTGEGPRSVITACRLIALDKGEGKVRPVAIGEAIRRIAARVACLQDNGTISAYLQQVMQYGVKVKGGIEYAYHYIRIHMMAMWDRHDPHEVDETETPGVLKVDFTNGYNSPPRSKLLTQVECKLPHMLRFVRYLYAQAATLVVMHEGKVVGEIESVFGTQQGDPLGGHFFALSIYDFMAALLRQFPEAAISWIVDDLTVSDKQGTLVEVAKMIQEQGPEYGLFKNATKGEVYSQMNLQNPDWKPMRALTHTYGYKHAPRGFKRLLGAPFGDEEFEVEMAEECMKELMAPVRHIKRLLNTQLEYIMLRYCLCTKPMHLLRMLEPQTVHPALKHYEGVVKAEVERIVGDAGRPAKLAQPKWKWAKLPVRYGGLGLQDLPLVSLAAFMATIGAVARMATRAGEYIPACTAPKLVRGWFNDDNDGFEQLLAKLADEVDGRDATNPLCPTLATLETMPSQNSLSNEMYKAQCKRLLNDQDLSREDRAWMLSCTQNGAGLWLNAIPSLQKFKCPPVVFKAMLQIRLCLPLAYADGVQQCKCGMLADNAMRLGRHWMTKCPKGHRIITHNKVRDVIAALYRELGVHVTVEVRGLYAQLTSYGEHKPADVLVPASATGADKAQALDITITDPTNKTALYNRSDKVPLKAASARHKAKLATHRAAVLEAGAGGLPFTKVPLVFETTGAMGKETQNWWEGIRQLRREAHEGSGPTSRRETGMDWTWSANHFNTFWLQSISVAHARTQAESVIQWIGTCQGA